MRSWTRSTSDRLHFFRVFQRPARRLLSSNGVNDCIAATSRKVGGACETDCHPLAICLIPVLLRPQKHSPTTRTNANAQASGEVTLGERLARKYEKQAGLGSTPELDGISRYISSVGSKVASVLPSGLQFHFVFDPNPDFKSAFALPGDTSSLAAVCWLLRRRKTN
jgi:hypothetical protein